MPSPAQVYVNGIRKKTEIYYAAWLPDANLTLGDVGTLYKRTLFRRKTNLNDLGIKFGIISNQAQMSFDLQSDKGIELSTKAAGGVNSKTPNIPQAKAGIAVDFSAKGAFVIKAPQTSESTIKDIASLENQVLDLYNKGKWKAEWVVIDTLVTAPNAAILISRSSQGKIELSVDAPLTAGTSVQLGDANLTFNISFSSGDIINMSDAKNITPFFQLFGLKHVSKPQRITRVDNLPCDNLSVDIENKVSTSKVSENKKDAYSLRWDRIWEPVTDT
jgi:hypothetical protein